MGQDTIVITGVTGQLGSYLAEHYLAKGFRVVGFSRRTAEHSTDRVDHLMGNPDFVYLEGDITDMTFLVKLLARYKPEYLVNTAAQSHVHTSFTNPGSTWDITGKGAINVIDSVLSVSPKTHVVQLSTSEMFGDQYDKKWVSEVVTTLYQDENTTLSPQSPYAVAKVAAHHYNRLMRETHNAHLSSLIAFNYESPRRGENFVTQKIVKWFKQHRTRREIQAFPFSAAKSGNLLQCKRIDMIPPERCNFEGDDIVIEGFSSVDKSTTVPKLRLGNLDAYRDWSHATDVVQAVDLMLSAEQPGDYVVGSGETRIVREFLQVVCKTVLGEDDYMKYVVIDPKFFRPAEVEYLRADPSKIKTVLGWEPQVSFTQLVEDMCNA